jgi:PASTA domain
VALRRDLMAVSLMTVAACACSAGGSHTAAPGGTPTGHRRMPVVARLRATLPAADDIDLSRPLFTAADRRACGRRLSASPRIRFLGPRRWLLVVRCGRASATPVAGVLVRFVDVRVPDMLGPTAMEMRGVTNRLGLRLRTIPRRVAGPPTRVVAQHPRPGSVVAFGTTVTIVIGQPSESR